MLELEHQPYGNITDDIWGNMCPMHIWAYVLPYVIRCIAIYVGLKPNSPSNRLDHMVILETNSTSSFPFVLVTSTHTGTPICKGLVFAICACLELCGEYVGWLWWVSLSQQLHLAILRWTPGAPKIQNPKETMTWDSAPRWHCLGYMFQARW